jgi:xanthine dehydrogenase YagS FAD-binding subunit
MCVALVALDAIVHTRGPRGTRVIAVRDFHTLPGDTPDVENLLQPGELITHVELAASAATGERARSSYVKVRDRASFAFALASAAVVLEVDSAGIVKRARIVLGGVATKPWRSEAAETALVGKTPNRALFETAASIAMQGASPGKHNAFKIDLGKITVVRALSEASGAS